MKFVFTARKNRKIISASLFVFVILVVIGCAATDIGTDEDFVEEAYVPKVETVIVSPGLSREISTTGEVRAAKSAMLTAEIRSDVKKVFVKIGDEVRTGQVLLQLASASVASTRSTAGAAFVNAQNSLTQTQLSSEKSIAAAQIGLQTAEINLANTLAQNSALRKQAKETLNSLKLSSELSISSADTSLDNAIRSAYPTAQNAIAESDEIIGVSSIYKNSNDSFEHFLGALKSASKRSAESAIATALNLLNSSAENYLSALTLLRSAENTTMATLDVLNNSVTGTTFTQTTLNSNVATITAQLSLVRNAISALETANAALESAQQSTDNDSQTVLSAQANYEATITQLEVSEKAIRQSVESAKATLESAIKSAELTQTSAKASFDSVAGNLNQARISESKLTIRAPFTGKIASIRVESGDEVAAGSSLIQVEDASQLKIIAYLSAAEIRKISVGDEVKIATKSSDKISAISPSADVATKKFEVEIFHQNLFLHPGEFVKLRFQIGEQDSTDARIFLPINSINILSYGSFVWKLTPQVSGELTVKVVKQAVQLGEIEGEFVEITDGLVVGEEVIVDGGRILDASEDEAEVEVRSGK